MSFKSLIKNFLYKKLKAQIRADYSYELKLYSDGRANGKVVIVTGANGGLGFAISLRLAVDGAIVGIAGRNEIKINKVKEDIIATYPQAKIEPLIIDVSDEFQMKSSITQFAELHQGRIDALVNNAGGGERNRHAPLWSLEEKVINEVLDTNLRGSMLCAKYVLPYMLPHRQGKIINLSSVMGMNGKEEWCAYSASKAGILGFTKALALECGHYNICVNAVSPGMVLKDRYDRVEGVKATNTNVLGRWGFTDEVASLISFLISDEANYITGQNFVIDGGRSIGLK